MNVQEKTFFLLPSSLPGTSAVDLLGSIVHDFRDPTADVTPTQKQPSQYVPAITRSINTIDSNAKIELVNAHSTTLGSKLFELFSAERTVVRNDDLYLESTRIRTTRLTNQTAIFEALLAQNEVRGDVERFLQMKGTRRLYFVVGLKTCLDARISRRSEVSGDHSYGAQVPLDAAIGVPLPVSMSFGGTVGWTNGSVSSSDSTTSGERIFAIQYRVISRDWFGYGAKTSLGRKVDGSSGGRFFAGNENESDEEDDDYDGVEDGNLGLIDDEFTSRCLIEEANHAERSFMYIFC